MARNEEKQLGRLNRLHLKKIHDDYEKKNPRRPKLETLSSTDDIRQWIPSIKKDIDFCLKQLQVPCYPERKIAEINVRITHLQGEYKAFVRKLREIDPKIKEIPWQDRPYQDRKRTSAYDLEKELKSQGKNVREILGSNL
ncbi:hypothetical protein FSP39_002146 [Pinctada imbricata]|uniref:Uncharacterized protein n=1 Tax=Pinctada imbricata TaxID=66713 RepID=A0AA88XPG3_PINIB|nr:hypothetical protein FSP39_002146 [Pinctada imbricata]